MSSELNTLSITEAAEKLQKKEISAVDLTRACLKEIEKRNPALNAYLEVFDDAESQAAEADKRRKALARVEDINRRIKRLEHQLDKEEEALKKKIKEMSRIAG